MVIISWGQNIRFLCTACLQSHQWTQNVMWTHKGNWEPTLHVSYSTRETPLVSLLKWQCRLTHMRNAETITKSGWNAVSHPVSASGMTVETYQEDDTIWTAGQDLYLLLIFSTVRKLEKCLQCCGHKHYNLHVCLENHRKWRNRRHYFATDPHTLSCYPFTFKTAFWYKITIYTFLFTGPKNNQHHSTLHIWQNKSIHKYNIFSDSNAAICIGYYRDIKTPG
jgi:hypothetical protein